MLIETPARMDEQISPRTRVLLMAVRQALLICLGAIEDYLQIERSITPKHQRREA